MEQHPSAQSAGDLEARFTALVEEHQLMVYRYARFVARDAHLAEEIAQDTLLVAYRKLKEEAPPTGDPGAWLRGIARNFCMRARAKKKLRVLFWDDEALETAEDFWVQSRGRSAASGQPDARLEALRACLRALDEDEGRLVRLRFEERQPREEMARLLGLSVEGVKTRLRRLRTRLLECTRRRLASARGPAGENP